MYSDNRIAPSTCQHPESADVLAVRVDQEDVDVEGPQIPRRMTSESVSGCCTRPRMDALVIETGSVRSRNRAGASSTTRHPEPRPSRAVFTKVRRSAAKLAAASITLADAVEHGHDDPVLLRSANTRRSIAVMG